jgi:type I restriction enzyme S subunit
MADKWLETTLGEIVELKRGYDLPKRKRVAGTVPVISSAGESDSHAVAKVTGPGVVTGRYGTIGEVYYCVEDYWPLNTTLYVRDFKGNDTKFVYYFLKTLNYREFSDKAAVPGVNRNHLHLATVRVPNCVETQKSIAHILGSLDDKIELNREMNVTLESMARALFKSWFVDFDPVIDKALAAGNPIPEPLSARAQTRRALAGQTKPLPDHIQKLFPDAFAFTEEAGWIPEGWIVSRLGGHLDFLTGPAFKSKDFTEEGVRLARGDNVKEGAFHWGTKTRYWPEVTNELKRYSLQEGDILIGMDGSKVGKNWVRVGPSDLPCLLVQRVACLRPTGSVGSSYLEVLIGGQTFKQYVNNVKTGTSIPHISGGQIKNMPILVPNDDGAIFKLFEQEILASSNKRDLLKSNSLTLTKLRDTLLPQLLSGSLRVPDAEQLVADSL